MKVEFLDLMVQNPIFGFLCSSLVNLCAYVEKSIRNCALVHFVLHCDLCTWLNECKNKKWILEALLVVSIPTKKLWMDSYLAMIHPIMELLPLFVEPLSHQ